MPPQHLLNSDFYARLKEREHNKVDGAFEQIEYILRAAWKYGDVLGQYHFYATTYIGRKVSCHGSSSLCASAHPFSV